MKLCEGFTTVPPVRPMNLKNVHDLIVRKSRKHPKFVEDAALGALADFLEQPTILWTPKSLASITSISRSQT